MEGQTMQWENEKVKMTNDEQNITQKKKDYRMNFLIGDKIE
jgi:hypothetical protein